MYLIILGSYFMPNKSEKAFISKAKKEIQQRLSTETKAVNNLENEKNELLNAIEGYENYYQNLNSFIIKSMREFTQLEEDLPKYFRSNINGTYQEYVQIRKDAINEMDALSNYIKHCKRERNNNKRTLKFYRSQYMDSDFFDECLPLVEIYQKKIDLYTENIKLTENTIEKLQKISKKLEKWV